MQRLPVLVLGSYKERRLNDALAQAGFKPVVRRNIDSALHKIRHDDFAGIVVERDWVDVDVLEFVLNVRDYDSSTRILVVGESQEPEMDETLNHMQRTFNIGGVDNPQHLTTELQGILDTQSD